MNNLPLQTDIATASRQRGLTLIELAVVLAILVALSTLLVPYVANYIGRAEVATSNYNAAAALNAMQQYYALYNAYPNNLDLLSDVNDQVVQYLDDTAQVGKRGNIQGTTFTLNYATNFGTMQDITGSMTASLAKVGVHRFWRMKTGTPTLSSDGLTWNVVDAANNKFDATYEAQDVAQEFTPSGPNQMSSQPTAMYVADNCGGYWMEGHPECLANILGYYTDEINYAGTGPDGGTHMLILLGINQNNEMVGKTITTAPVHFPDKKSVNPTNVYSRFLAVFDVDMKANCVNDPKGCDPAKLIAVVVGPDATRGWQTVTTGMARAFNTE